MVSNTAWAWTTWWMWRPPPDWGFTWCARPSPTWIPWPSHTLGAILALAKNMLPLEKAARRADFDAPLSFESHDIGGKTLGIIGLGNIGRTLAKKGPRRL